MSEVKPNEPRLTPTYIGALLSSWSALSALLSWHVSFDPQYAEHEYLLPDLLAYGLLLSSPSIAVVLFLVSRMIRKEVEPTIRVIFETGLIYGTMASILNVYAYVVALGLSFDLLVFMRVPLAFVVAGGTAGLWVSWRHAVARRMKLQFGLGPLVISASTLGLLLWVFSVHSGVVVADRIFFRLD